MKQGNFFEKINNVILSYTQKKYSVDIVGGDLAKNIGELQKALGYNFRNIGLLFHALTHKSAIVPEKDNAALGSNERLELLGDSILAFLLIEELYIRYPKYTEGEISKIKSLIVSRKIIGEIAESMNIMDAMILGKSYEKLKSVKTDVSSNALEALIAAIYLDSGIDSVRKVLKDKLFPQIEMLVECEDNINYKAIVLEYAQKNKISDVKYDIISQSGPDHCKIFTVEIEIDGKKYGTASGNSKKCAGQLAAKIAAEKLGLLDNV
ncbi:MAG: ribonuclease III [Chitinivibrionia bacterium]|nr:ribonuclease III [Chitinivibrionia bacterium]